MTLLNDVLRYHERTKHHPGRYAAGPGGLDWATQPDAFRRYAGASQIALSLPEPLDSTPGFDEAVRGAVPAHPISSQRVSQLLFDALAISAWKVAGDSRWAVRCNPSSGNLHPTEAYLLLPAIEGLSGQAGLFHYNVQDHALELRREASTALWHETVAGLPRDSFLMALTSVHWREAWKYGERAYRYCQHDVGHAVAQLSYAAAAMGWSVRILPEISDASIAALAGVDSQQGEESEHADVMLCISPRSTLHHEHLPATLTDAIVQAWQALPLHGTPNVLSPTHRPWPEIGRVATACTQHALGDHLTLRDEPAHALAPAANEVDRNIAARALYRRRRSAVSMDGYSAMARADFFGLLKRLQPSAMCPWTAFPWPAAIHPVIFVHRVDDLEPGAYLLIRNAARGQDLRAALTRFPDAEPLPGWDGAGELFCLARGNVQNFAHNSNCLQEIASDGAFSVAMLSDFRATLERHGAWSYRRLFWEAGILGQVLYLEAEAAGLRGTGSGCFFDDMIHDALGLHGDAFQCLYGFTVGGAVEDHRVGSEPAYSITHSQRGRV